jgi:hypothetical protein
MVSDQVRLRSLASALRGSDKREIEQKLEFFSERPPRLVKNFDAIKKAFEDADKLDLFFELLLSRDSATFEQLSLIARIGILAKDIDRIPQFEMRANHAMVDQSGIRFRSFEDRRRLLKSVEGDQRLFRVLMKLKYKGIRRLRVTENFIETARVLSNRIDINPTALGVLYASSHQPQACREDWEGEIRTAFSVQHLIADTRVLKDSDDDLIDPAAKERALRDLDTSRGLLFLLCHAGYTHVLFRFVDREIPNSVYLASSSKRIPIHLDPRGSLFAGLKALLQKKVVVITPDGQQGSRNCDISVLGRKVPIGDGAAFLAYESRCATMWATMNRNGDRFVPNLVSGPVRDSAESFEQFQGRFNAFYERMLNEFFCGDPQNLLIGQRWLNVFCGPEGDD